MNVTILMQNQNLQHSLRETSVQANTIIHAHLAINRHMISGLADVLKSIKIAFIIPFSHK